jgi:DNA-binding transcriptional regulator YhcF (GntR family)
MRETLSQIKQNIRKQIATRDKLVVLNKAPNGQIIEVLEGQWVEANFLEELKEQATLNKQEYEGFVKTEQNAKDELIVRRFELLAKEYENAIERIKALEHEIAVIKGVE